ncbi:MAG: hypothetical protein Q9184_000383 [Pyrenodesmia sp. 2 TL-2023]
MPSLYIPPNLPSPGFTAYLKTSTEMTSPEAHVYRTSEMDRAAVTSAPTPTFDLPVPPSSPRPAPLDRDIDVFRKKTPSPGPRFKGSRRLQSPRYTRPRPKLRIKNPKTTPVDPYDRPAPCYHDWHPTSVMWEYQLQRGLGVSERVFELCRFFNKANSEHRGRVGDAGVWKGHEHRIEWLYWYWGEKNKKRAARIKREADELVEKEQERIVQEMERFEAEVSEAAWNVQEPYQDGGEEELGDRDWGVVKTMEVELPEESRKGSKVRRRRGRGPPGTAASGNFTECPSELRDRVHEASRTLETVIMEYTNADGKDESF